ncbi:MAG TPA: hypothetical protein VFU21_29905, partial [Kofleriaceae bacterium]|nr:hypothetical protein [Kofleriaceae bacterium]
VVRLAADTLERTGLGQPPGTELEVTAGAAWFLEAGPVAIWRIALPDGAAELAAQLDQAVTGSGLAVARPDVAFLATSNGDDPGLPQFLTRVGLQEGVSEQLVDLDSLVAIEADGEHVYWLGDRNLSRMSVDGGCIETREQGGDSLLIANAADGIVVATGGFIALVER